MKVSKQSSFSPYGEGGAIFSLLWFKWVKRKKKKTGEKSIDN